MSRARKKADLVNRLMAPIIERDGEPVTPKVARGADLRGADLRGADLRHADLRSADLRGANLAGARLDHADLSWAHLRGADLSRACLHQARLVEAELWECDLDDTDLRDATGLTWASVRDATNTRSTRWPRGFNPQKPRVAGPLLHHAGH